MSRRTLTALVGAGVLAAAGAGATVAFGHAEVKTRTPKPGSTVSAPKTIRISFSEAVVTGKFASITRNGKAVKFTSTLSKHKAAITAKPSSKLGAGTYKVSWRVLADDGDTQKGHWSFKVR